jgi:hypothetical protein
MLKSELLRAIQQEIQRHHFSHFIDNPPSVAQAARVWLSRLSDVPEENQYDAAVPESSRG